MRPREEAECRAILKALSGDALADFIIRHVGRSGAQRVEGRAIAELGE